MSASVSTVRGLNDSERTLLLIHGYVRGLELLESFKEASIKIPKEIINLIAMLYPNKFRFQSDHPVLTVSEDGLVVSNPRNAYGTILFGEFISQDDRIIYTVSFKLEDATRGYWGFGFATSKFSQFEGNTHTWNMENQSRIIYYAGGEKGNGRKWKTEYFSEIASFDSDNSEGFNNGDTVCIEMNMISKVGKVYNKLHPDKPTALIDLHSDDGIAIAVSAGYNAGKVRTVEQKFEYVHP